MIYSPLIIYIPSTEVDYVHTSSVHLHMQKVKKEALAFCIILLGKVATVNYYHFASFLGDD